MSTVVTRIPPSPTGHLHIGTARTALFNFLFARHHGGSFIYRSEDTDRERSTRAFEDEIREGLEWLGLTTDSFSRQSERGHIYREHLLRIVDEGKAYISEEESTKRKGEMVAVVRLRNPNKAVVFSDLVRGEISFDTTELKDFVIARSVDDALYHFSVVLDDYLMGVTHVIRGEDHISNTPRQILIQEALGAPRPIYAHLPLILAPDRSKMSKRHGATSLVEYRNEGFLKEAIINYLALLGWSPGTDEEFFSLDELVARFDISGIQKGGAIFNREKLLWFNQEYVQRLPDAEIMDRLFKVIQSLHPGESQHFRDRITRALPSIRERLKTLKDLEDFLSPQGEYEWIHVTPTPTPELLTWKKDPSPKVVTPRIEALMAIFKDLPPFPDRESIEAGVLTYAETVGKGEALWPLRVALSGLQHSPDPYTLAFILGRDEVLLRLQNAHDILEK